MRTESFLKWTGLIGFGLVVSGLVVYYRQRKSAALGGYRYMPGQFEEPPIVGGYSDGKTTTTMHASDDMPIQERIGSIQKLIEKSVQDPEMRALAIKLTAHCPDRDGRCEAKAIYKAVKKQVRYTGDVAPIKMSNGQTEGIDLYQSARKTWEMGGGDCDDQTILIGALTSSIGLTTRLRVIAEDPYGDDGHIYPVVLLPKYDPQYAVAIDTTLPGSNKFGVEAPAGRITDFDA